MLALDKVTREEFAACLGQEFEVIVGTEKVALRLVEAKAYGTGHPGRREPFSLQFQGPPGLRLPQAIYAMRNEELGEMEVFVVQVGADGKGTWFEAVFN